MRPARLSSQGGRRSGEDERGEDERGEDERGGAGVRSDLTAEFCLTVL